MKPYNILMYSQDLHKTNEAKLLWKELSKFRAFTLFGVINPSTAVGALRALIDFTLSNGRRFCSSMGNPLAVKGLTASKTMSPITL